MEPKVSFNYSINGFGEFSNSSNITTELTSLEGSFKWTDAEIVRLIQIIFRPILIIVGTVGNGLTIYIMRRTSLKHLSSCYYMAVLALQIQVSRPYNFLSKWVSEKMVADWCCIVVM